MYCLPFIHYTILYSVNFNFHKSLITHLVFQIHNTVLLTKVWYNAVTLPLLEVSLFLQLYIEAKSSLMCVIFIQGIKQHQSWRKKNKENCVKPGVFVKLTLRLNLLCTFKLCTNHFLHFLCFGVNFQSCSFVWLFSLQTFVL